MKRISKLKLSRKRFLKNVKRLVGFLGVFSAWRCKCRTPVAFFVPLFRCINDAMATFGGCSGVNQFEEETIMLTKHGFAVRSENINGRKMWTKDLVSG